jgi:hypothetical protein
VRKGRSNDDHQDRTGRSVRRSSQSAARGRKAITHPLAQTRLAGDNKREEWLAGIAELSSEEGWHREKAEIKVHKSVEKAVFARRITTEKSFANVVTEGLLATDPDVRDHVSRLIALRDQAWPKVPAIVRDRLHGPSQMLMDLMRRQRTESERHHTASVEKYLTYLRRRFTG